MRTTSSSGKERKTVGIRSSRKPTTTFVLAIIILALAFIYVMIIATIHSKPERIDLGEIEEKANAKAPLFRTDMDLRRDGIINANAIAPSKQDDMNINTVTNASSAEKVEPVRQQLGHTCNNFFTVLSDVWGVPFRDDSCQATLKHYQGLLIEHNAQMTRMKSELTLYTAWANKDFLLEPGCNLDAYPAIRMVQFDPEGLLLKNGYSAKQVQWIKQWKDVPYNNGKEHKQNRRAVITRLSDIFRILLARENGMAYMDLDLFHLSNDPSTYLSKPNVAMPVWGDATIEIQNSGWCLSEPQLKILANMAVKRIEAKGEKQTTDRTAFAYTELGKSASSNRFKYLNIEMFCCSPTVVSTSVTHYIRIHSNFTLCTPLRRAKHIPACVSVVARGRSN